MKYILITPAYNEEKHIEKTILSVIRQSIKPEKWIIVSDRSIDKTDGIILKYAKKYNYIKFLKIKGDSLRNYSAKVNAINQGLLSLKKDKYDFIGILDADLAFKPDYFKKLFFEFKNNKKLGIAGGNYLQTINGQVKPRRKSLNSVAGGVQMFRKKCFEDINGFIALKYGCEDAIAEITARMKGWEVQTFPELEVTHYGYVGGKGRKLLNGRYKRGKSYYLIGYLFLYMVLRSFIRIKESPFFIGSIIEIAGYLIAMIKYKRKYVSSEFIQFLQKEQKEKLKNIIK